MVPPIRPRPLPFTSLPVLRSMLSCTSLLKASLYKVQIKIKCIHHRQHIAFRLHVPRALLNLEVILADGWLFLVLLDLGWVIPPPAADCSQPVTCLKLATEGNFRLNFLGTRGERGR
jgi:hypothetical protein